VDSARPGFDQVSGIRIQESAMTDDETIDRVRKAVGRAGAELAWAADVLCRTTHETIETGRIADRIDKAGRELLLILKELKPRTEPTHAHDQR
jgi:hypothetical protein